MNWGKGIALVLAAFALMMAWFAWKAAQHPSPLVTEDYYGQELKFQQQIDAAQRTHRFSLPVHMQVSRHGVDLTFPQELDGEAITGTLTLQRPNNPGADREMQFKTQVATVSLPLDLVQGRYNASLEWRLAEETFLSAEKLYVP